MIDGLKLVAKGGEAIDSLGVEEVGDCINVSFGKRNKQAKLEE